MTFSEVKNRLKLETFRVTKGVRQFITNRSKSPTLTSFVAGHQRSGTNMVMNVLEKHWRTDAYHETDARAFNDYQMRDIPTIKNLREKSNGDIFIVKSLCELDLLDQLMEEFEPCKIIWVYRHYNDVVNSMVKSFNNTAKNLRWIKEDRSAGGWRSRNISDDNYALIQELVNDDMTEVSAAALQWVMRNSIYFEKGFNNNDNVMLLNYEDLVSQPQVKFKEIFEFLGVEDQPETYSKVFSSSIGKNKIPDISPDILEQCNDMLEKLNSRYKNN